MDTKIIQLSLDLSAPKLCECGCGQPTPLQWRTFQAKNLFRGQPARFIFGHYAPKPRLTPEERKQHRRESSARAAKERKAKRHAAPARRRQRLILGIPRTIEGKRNPAYYRAYRLRYKGRKRNALGIASTQQIAARWAMWGGMCWMCGKAANSTDHVIPLSKGGTNWPANLRPACKSCNSRKGARKVHRFRE